MFRQLAFFLLLVHVSALRMHLNTALKTNIRIQNSKFTLKPLQAVLKELPEGVIVNPRRFLKSTKQIATLGPSVMNFEMIEKLFLAGADVFRLNFSHGEHHEKAALVSKIRKVEAKYRHPIAILADLQGPKLRVGMFEEEKVYIETGQKFTFDYNEKLGNSERVRLPHPEILNTLKVGDTVLLDDGKLRMKVITTTMQSDGLKEGKIECEVINGGALSNRKGVNTPSIVLPISPLTPKDRRDLDFALSIEVDWVALSFVQRPEDVKEIKSIVGKKVRVMAKLEKPSAIKHLEEIVDMSDGIMVARGDLGVEMFPWDVPIIQKQIIETCKSLGKPVVVATQMLESMIDNPTPTRAEASDVATAIYDSADAVMLSAESAAGKFPIEAVTMQQNIINAIEQDATYKTNLDRFAQESTVRKYKDASTTAITLAARQVADISKSRAIVAFTTGGGTAIRMAKVRPKVPIITATYRIEVARQLALAWGLYPIVLPSPATGEFNVRDELIKVCGDACSQGFANPDTDLLTVTCGLPFGTPGTTNVIRVSSAKGPDYWFDSNGSGGPIKYGTTASPL